jgi:uncharacterized protein
MKNYAFSLLVLLAAAVLFTVSNTARAVSITTFGATYNENFDTLASSGTSSTVPAGWAFSEAGSAANTTYTAGTGSDTTGDTYSFGATASSERAFGGLQSGALIPTIGVQFQNNTGGTITSLLVDYFGEQWRLGATGRTDRLDFQYSLNATSLTTGTWMDFDSLDFTAPTTAGATGALDGNAAANRLHITSTITGLNVGAGSTFWFRWNDLNASGSDDGLGVDDFALTAQGNFPGVPDSLPFGWVAATLLSVLVGKSWLSKRAGVAVTS